MKEDREKSIAERHWGLGRESLMESIRSRELASARIAVEVQVPCQILVIP
jgi:hypothetical protein